MSPIVRTVGFNSIKVRLKLLMVHLIVSFRLFQFHKGTIKTTIHS